MSKSEEQKKYLSGTMCFRINIIKYDSETKEKTVIEKVGDYSSNKLAEELYDLVPFVKDPTLDKELLLVTTFTGKEEEIVLLTTIKDLPA